MKRRTAVQLATFIIGAAVGVPLLLAAAGAVIVDVEIGTTSGTIGHTGDSVLKLGDNTDDAVLVQSGTGDPVIVTVNGGTQAAKVSSALSPGAGLPGIVTFDLQSRTRWSLVLHPQIVATGVWVPIEFDFGPGAGSVDHFDQHLESLPGAPGVAWTFTPAEAGYYQVNSRTEVHLEQDPAGGDAKAVPTPPAAGAVSIAIFKTDVTGITLIHSQGNNLQMFAMTGPPFPPGMEPHQHEVLLEGNNAPNVSDVVYLIPGDAIEIRVFVGASIPGTGQVATLLAEPQATYVSVHKLS